MNFISRIRNNSTKITMGGQTWQPDPLNLERALQLSLVLAPHIALLENHWGEFKAVLDNTSGDRPALLSSLFTTMAGEMRDTPGAMTEAVSILVDRTPQWMADHGVTAAEIIKALPVLDSINDFAGLLASIQGLGLTVKYARN